MLQKRLSPTLLASLEYCNRLFYLNMKKPHHGTLTELTVLGNFEHSVIEQFYKLTKNYWKTQNEFENDNSLDERISLAVNDAIEIGRKNFALFFDHIMEIVNICQPLILIEIAQLYDPYNFGSYIQNIPMLLIEINPL